MSSMINAYIIRGKELKIWGLTPYERLEKSLRKRTNIKLIENINNINADDNIILFNGDYIFDERVIDFLINHNNTGIIIGESQKPQLVAIHTNGQFAKNCTYAIKENKFEQIPRNIEIKNISDIITPSFQKSLRKADKPFILNATENDKDFIEDKLYYSSYKGVTDIITRIVWPKPAKLAVKFCVKYGITPNCVTTFSLILAIIAGLLFYKNQYALGLIVGWFMTFLDTVDGKLARVTISSTKFGHLYDHVIDLVHPIYWYICWGLSLSSLGVPMNMVWLSLLIIIIFYAVGRFVEGGFKMLIKAPFSIFCWKPFDSFFRLITARRNPNLLILTVAAIFKAYDTGLYLVAIWTFLSSIILLIRFILALKEKKEKGSLKTWLNNIDSDLAKKKKIYKLFIYDY